MKIQKKRTFLFCGDGNYTNLETVNSRNIGFPLVARFPSPQKKQKHFRFNKCSLLGLKKIVLGQDLKMEPSDDLVNICFVQG